MQRYSKQRATLQANNDTKVKRCSTMGYVCNKSLSLILTIVPHLSLLTLTKLSKVSKTEVVLHGVREVDSNNDADQRHTYDGNKYLESVL